MWEPVLGQAEEGEGVSWARLDDGFLTHPKAMAAGIEGRALFVAALLYASRELTDGDVSEAAMVSLGGLAGVRNPKRVADQLVAVGLFDSTDDGYQIHDYLTYNPSREKVLAEREASALRANKWRDKRRAYGRTNGVTHTGTNAVSALSPDPLSPREAKASQRSPTEIQSADENVSHSPPLKPPKRTVPTEEWAAEQRAIWGPKLRDFDDTLRFHMNRDYYKSAPDKCAYLEGAFKRAAEREQGSRNGHAPPKANVGQRMTREDFAGIANVLFVGDDE